MVIESLRHITPRLKCISSLDVNWLLNIVPKLSCIHIHLLFVIQVLLTTNKGRTLRSLRVCTRKATVLFWRQTTTHKACLAYHDHLSMMFSKVFDLFQVERRPRHTDMCKYQTTFILSPVSYTNLCQIAQTPSCRIRIMSLLIFLSPDNFFQRNIFENIKGGQICFVYSRRKVRQFVHT